MPLNTAATYILMEPVFTAPKTFRLDSALTPHTAEVLAADVRGALSEGSTTFRFHVDLGFLPTICWFNRLLGVLKPVIGDKHHVEVACSAEQSISLHQFGFHLIASP